jgi:hypothetical protein
VHHLQSAFEEANSYSRYHPSKGYSWDLKERKVPERLAAKKETQREEPSSLFQRHRVDMLLAELTRKFPIPVAAPPQKQPAPGVLMYTHFFLKHLTCKTEDGYSNIEYLSQVLLLSAPFILPAC